MELFAADGHDAGGCERVTGKSGMRPNEGLPRIHGQNGLRVRLDGPQRTRIFWSSGDPVGNEGWSAWQTRLISEILPHVRQFVRVRHALAQSGARNRALGKLIENNDSAIIELDRQGRVRTMNNRGQELLKEGSLLTDQDNRIVAASPIQQAELQGVCNRAAPVYGTSAQSGSLTLRDQDGRIGGVVHAIPTDERSARFRSPEIATVLVIAEAGGSEQEGATELKRRFQLTISEAEIAMALAEGKSLRQIADETNRTKNTVIWHKKHIFTSSESGDRPRSSVSCSAPASARKPGGEKAPHTPATTASKQRRQAVTR